ncbi:MmcQ/YjbR family DNA-binding protein [Leekyejoonella antrihumi]|uniref:MmcQ/YjbR family DNA-binding protein n=1 Tax=Leekyejoonella antrihumi TaxID=1660198 RepID=UPI001FE836ED|nr:MmcQ/YjbR family DNA-binding protein [Leekyejoonella antrihumi]
MPHPLRFTDDDPYLNRLRGIALSFPDAAERVSHGRPIFFTQRTFALFGAMVKGDHQSDVWSQSVVIQPDPEERDVLLSDERFFSPAYYGPHGWIGLNFRAAEPDWDEVTELVDMSYRNTALKRQVRLLDNGAGPLRSEG